MPPTELRIAAVGDIHCRQPIRDRVIAAFEDLEGEADLALIAGDLTSLGTVAEAQILAAAARRVSLPVFAVLGNHDWQGDEAEEIAAALRESGVTVLEREAVRLDIDGLEVGIVGCKGFVGGFAPRHLPDFGEPSLRAVYAETGADVEALDAGLHEVATCPVRIVLLHYAPIAATLDGEPPEIFAFLGSDRLAAPILEHGPDLVLHGHAHAGSPEGRIGDVPVHNVSLPLLDGDFWRLDMRVESAYSPIP